MSAIFFSRFRVFVKNYSPNGGGGAAAATATVPSILYSRHFLLDHQRKWCHGLPGIPNDNKVVRLTNSKNGSQVYLVGTCHISEESAETVKKVINLVRPDSVAVELCRRRAKALVDWKPENDNLYKMFIKSAKAPGGLKMKLGMFILNIWYSRLRADGIFPGKEFKVAIEESKGLNAKLAVIDEDVAVLWNKLSKILTFGLFRRLYRDRNKLENELEKLEEWYNPFQNHKDYTITRSSVTEIIDIQKKVCPELVKILITERDWIMFERLRRIEGNIVAVVGLGHMDGIERYWKVMEDVVIDQQPATTSKDAS